MELSAVLENIDSSREDIIKVMVEMTGIPSMSPEIGGIGESKRADMLQRCLVGYDSVQRIDVPDEHDPSIKRSNILAKKEGKRKGTVWIVAHIDTVPAGDVDAWETDPFKGVVKGDRIYGRGTEDNGQAVISSMFASKFIPADILMNKSIGIAYVADEEVSSRMGIGYLLDHGYFSPDDVFLVPDWGSPEGSMIDVAEKSLIWLKFEVMGKTTHGSTPNKGRNAFRAGSYFMSELMSKFAKEFNDVDELFDPAISTFEPTKCEVTSENINTIPGKFVFYMDIRVIPKYNPDEILSVAEEMAREFECRTGTRISVTEVLRHVSGKVSSTDTDVYNALCDSVESVVGRRPTATGVGGATCANFFRAKGYDAYVWEYGGGTLHAPNEYVLVSNIMTDAKVFATFFYKLCVSE